MGEALASVKLNKHSTGEDRRVYNGNERAAPRARCFPPLGGNSPPLSERSDRAVRVDIPAARAAGFVLVAFNKLPRR